MSITVLYFASLRDAAGVDSEQVNSPDSLAALNESLRARHGFALQRERLRVAVDGDFVPWVAAVRAGAEVALNPPVSGG